MNIAEKYIQGLKEAYFEKDAKVPWEHFEQNIHGAKAEDIAKLKELYPNIPEALVSLLKYVDGTYFREYAGEKILFYLLGSDVEDYQYPYYLLSAAQIIENANIAVKYYSDYIERAYDEDEVKMDERITDKSDAVKWLHFSDCVNNGGTSQLFIDFSPSEKGTMGQVVRFLHDPDEFAVIADSFEGYLKILMNNEFAFINEDTVEDIIAEWGE